MLVVLSCVVALPAASANEVSGTDTEEAERDWSIDFTPYVWVVNIDGEIGGGPIDDRFGVGIIDILEHLKGLAMADLIVRYKRVGLIGDGMWAKIETSETRPRPGPVGTIHIDLDLGLAFGTGAAFYEFRPTENLTLDPYIGAR
jgi:ribosomal protein L11 methylase PrmA